jgi:pimeloyl-ACP methyl ester carboxylesterase
MPSGTEPRERTAELGGLRLHWVEWGDDAAPAIVALHGMSAMCRIWDPLGRALQDRYRVIALDQRGHGDTSWPKELDYSTDDYVRDLEALVEYLGLERFALIALSMGGMNAMAYAAKHPERVTHLVAVDIRPAVNADKRPNREQDKRTADNGHTVFPNLEGAFIARKFMHPHTPDDSIRHHVQHLLKQLPDGQWTNKHDPRVSCYWKPRNLWSELPKITAPVLIVRGGQSYVLSGDVAEEMRAAFPNAELVTIEAAGHTVPEDQPQAFIDAVEAFLAKNPLSS